MGSSWTMRVKIISSGGKLERVESPSHPIDVVVSKCKREAIVSINKKKIAKQNSV